MIPVFAFFRLMFAVYSADGSVQTFELPELFSEDECTEQLNWHTANGIYTPIEDPAAITLMCVPTHQRAA